MIYIKKTTKKIFILYKEKSPYTIKDITFYKLVSKKKGVLEDEERNRDSIENTTNKTRDIKYYFGKEIKRNQDGCINSHFMFFPNGLRSLFYPSVSPLL